MNFLAHLLLAGRDPHLLVGNFIADHVKGRKIDDYPERIQYGIRMHRAIDSFTDQNPIVRKSILRLRPVYSKYAGVIVDMYYDHFLALHWSQYSSESLLTFTTNSYAILQKHSEFLPARSLRTLTYMSADNWLMAYATMEGMQQAFNGMSRRTVFVSGMENAVTDLVRNYPSYREEFNEYFPELQQFVESSFEK